jgi:hypothetical protein
MKPNRIALRLGAALLALALLILVPWSHILDRIGAPVHAQNGATPVQITGQRQDVGTKFCTTTATVNGQVTCTMQPSGSNYAYITSIDLMVAQNGTGTANTNLTFTTTNITGAPVFQESLAATANLSAPPHTIVFATPLKSATPGAAVTIVSPAAQTNTAFTISASWYEGQ